MPSTIMPVFEKFPEEGRLIGRLLAGYGEIELELCFCVAVAREDHDMVFKSMYRPRGETQRIDIADAIGRRSYYDLGMGTAFAEVIGAVKYCLKIRNQFAHCLWHDDYSGPLAFVVLEDLARKNVHVPDFKNVEIRYIEPGLLREQEAFFLHTRDTLRFLNFEGRLRRDLIQAHAFEMPAKIKRPDLSSPAPIC